MLMQSLPMNNIPRGVTILDRLMIILMIKKGQGLNMVNQCNHGDMIVTLNMKG